MDAAGTPSNDLVAVRAPRLLLTALTATPFVYVPGVLYPSVVPRALYFRGLVALAVFLIGLMWARDRVTFRFVSLSHERVAMGLVLFTGVSFLSAAVGTLPMEGMFGDMIRMDGAVAWLGYLLFFFLLRFLLDDETWRPFLGLSAAVCAVVAVWSLVQAYGESFGVVLVGWGADRVVGTLGLSGSLAAYLILGAAISGWLAMETPDRFGRWVWAAIALLDLWVVALSGTRSALVAVMVALGVVWAWSLVASKPGSTFRRATLGTVAGFVVTLVSLFLVGTVDGSVARLFDLGWDALNSRLHLWWTAWRGFLEHPFLGSGFGSFELLYDRHFQASDYLASAAEYQDKAHNVILGTLAESGLVGLTAYLTFWGTALGAVISALRTSKNKIGAVWLATGIVAYFIYLLLWFEDLASFQLLLVILAFLEHQRLAKTKSGEPAGGNETSNRSGEDGRVGLGRWSVVGTLLIVLGSLGWYHGQVLGAAREARHGLSARSPLEPFRHFSRALDYRTVTTRAITSRFVSGLSTASGMTRNGRINPDADSLAMMFDRAERAVEAEIARQPQYSAIHARMAKLYRARWHWSGKVRYFRLAELQLHEALADSPERIRYLHQLARLHTLNGNPGRAMDVLRQAHNRLPGWWETWNTMAQVQWDAGNRERAVELLLRAARTDVRLHAAGTGTQFMVRAGSWLEARGTPMRAVELFEAYLGTRYPGWDEPSGEATGDVPAAALPIAARLPITLMHAGRIDEAARAARRLRERLPPHLRRPVVTDRLDRFLTDMEAGRVGAWRDAWGVLPTDVPLEG